MKKVKQAAGKNAEISLGSALKRLEELVAWFDSQEAADVEQGLEKVREGAVLIAATRSRLASLENEFTSIKDTLKES